MSYVKIAVRLRWKSGLDGLTMTLSQVLIYNLFNKILGYYCFVIHFSSSMKF